MSLFKIFNLWTIKSSDITKSYDSNSLHCCRLNVLDSDEKDYIIIGSHNGFLSIYQPIFNAEEENENFPSFSASNVVLEAKLDAPIIALASGKFSTCGKNETRNLLAVLHPLKLVIYAITPSDSNTELGDSSRLQIVQEHSLQSHAFDMCKGHFGGYKGREFLCVYHLDGTLKFFEQDGIVVDCQLLKELTIPSKFMYVPRIDCFVTLSSSWVLECFRYQDIIDAKQLNKNIVPIWTLCIGEGILDMNVNQVSKTESVIVLLGENNLICTSDTGKIKFIKRLDYVPVCLCSFVIGWYWENNARMIITILSENGTLLIYDQMILMWAAQLSFTDTIAIQRSNIQGLPGGAIVTLNNKGILNVGYLGSDPYIFKAPLLNLQQLDFQKAYIELNELETCIKKGVDISDVKIQNAAAERDIKIQLTMNPNLETCAFTAPNCSTVDDDQKRMARLSIAFKPLGTFEQVQVTIFVNRPLKSSIERYVFKEPTVNETEHLDTYIYVTNMTDIPSMVVQVFFTCINKQSIVRIIERQIPVAHEMIYKEMQPQREAKYKITLTCDSNVEFNHIKHFGSIFSEAFFTKEKEPNIHAFGFKSIYSGNIVSIAVSKNTNRYRIQADSIEILTPFLMHLIEKLTKPVTNEKKNIQNAAKVTISPPFIPIEFLVSNINAHYQKRQEYNNLMLEIDRRNAELRLFESRFIVKSQEENAKLSGIQYLIDLTNNKIATAEKFAKLLLDDLLNTQIRLSSTVLLIKTVVKHIGLHTKVIQAISNTLNHCIYDYFEQSWEEAIYPSLDFLNHIGSFNKNEKLKDYFQGTTSEQSIEFDFQTFLTHVKTILTRVIQMSNTVNDAEREKYDEFFGNSEDSDKGLMEKSEWLNETLPVGASVLLGEYEEAPQIKQEDNIVESNTEFLPKIHEDSEFSIEDQFSVENSIPE
ncbi:protein PTHB1 [Culicoides brevitarsis]|uniref:protein PTHB1 n=1 Tax=Culicoides brevitarsis TaxID=469753 RepID=UPI00307B5366